MSSSPPEDMEATRVGDVEIHQGFDSSIQRDKAYLIVLAGSNVGEMHRLEGAESVIGRSSGATIRLNDDGISRRHARLLQLAGEVIIEDMNSANGTLVNGEVVTHKALQDGDKIRLGSTTILKFTYHDRLDESFQQQMYDAALRDGLTRAYNRKYFLDRLETEVAYARRHRADLSLVMLDVDHFKKVNDTFGHLAGDEVLVALAKIALSTLRAEDVFARYGGEEFSIICRGVTLENAGILAERLRQSVEQASFDYEGRRMPITISLGVAAYPNLPIEAATQLVAAADEALYQAKNAGRNRVMLKYGPDLR